MSSLPTRSLDAIVRRAVANFRSAFPSLPMGSKRFLGRMARATARVAWGLHKAIEDIDVDLVPSSKMSADVLTEWADLTGLPDGAGGYGRLQPTAASGGQATLTGVLGTIYPDGAIAVAEDGTTQIKLSGSVTIAGTPPGFGSVVGKFVAITTGSVGNLAAGTVCTWQSPPAGADSSFTITSPLGGGEDLESNPDTFSRLKSRLQTPPRGGTAEDYREWCQSVAGIDHVYVYPCRSGTGTVDLVIVGGGSGMARVPSESLLSAVFDVVDAVRPAGAEAVNVMVPFALAGRGHRVRVRIVPASSRFAFEWDDTAASYVVGVGGYVPGPPAKITIGGLAPDSLKSAIDAYKASAGDAPRLQVMSTGVVINAPIACVDWSDSGGNTTLTLDTVTAAWTPPSDGDSIYAYGPVVATIAQAILSFCDGLGPSRASGFADAVTPWVDKLTISGIMAMAEEAIDSAGDKLIAEVLPDGATIDGVVDDVEGIDSTGEAPELLYLSSVAVTA